MWGRKAREEAEHNADRRHDEMMDELDRIERNTYRTADAAEELQALAEEQQRGAIRRAS